MTGKNEAARIAAAIRAILETDIDSLPDLPTGKRMTRKAAPISTGPGTTQRNNTPAPASSHDFRTPTRAPEPVMAPPSNDFDEARIHARPSLTIESLPNELASLREYVAGCERCMLHKGRTATVFGEGPVNPILMIVGESPGRVEEQVGRPFAGEEGQLLGRIITAMGLDREKDCYLTTVLKCRAEKEQPVSPGTVELCRPFLSRQIALVRPRFLLAMGQTAAMVLAGSGSITRLRGRFLTHDDIPMLVTYHPTALLREPALKKLVWEDVKLIMARMKH